MTHGGPRTPGPGKALGRPRGEPTIRYAIRVPERVLGAFRARWGDRMARRIVELMERDTID